MFRRAVEEFSAEPQTHHRIDVVSSMFRSFPAYFVLIPH